MIEIHEEKFGYEHVSCRWLLTDEWDQDGILQQLYAQMMGWTE